MKKNLSLRMILIVLFGCFLVSSCSTKQSEGTSVEKSLTAMEEKKEEVKPSSAYSLFDGLSLRNEPSKKGKWLSSVTLGEKVTYLGTSALDTADKDRKYLNVQLSDETVGWVVDYGMSIDSELAATKKEAPIYKRPDLLTITDDKIPAMSMLVVEEEKDGFLKVVGKERKKKGWIEKSLIEIDAKEVAVAVLAEKQLVKDEDVFTTESLKKFVETVPYKSTQFYKSLVGELDARMAEQEIATEEPAEEETDAMTGEEAVEEELVEN